jgi:site-specific DNA recombinase
MKAIVYARVSTDEQREKGYSLQSQVDACLKYAQEQGFTVVEELRDDFTGTKLDRPGLDRLRSMVCDGQAEAVICLQSDRWSRNLAHVLILKEEMKRAGVELHFVNRGKNEDTPENRMTENIEGVFNEYWKEKILEGCKRGKVGKARSGRWVGAFPPPYGYNRSGEKRDCELMINEYQAGIIRLIFQWYVVGEQPGKPLTAYAIVANLNEMEIAPPGGPRGPGRCWNPATVGTILKNRAYIGEWDYKAGAEVVTVSIPPILEDDRLFFEAQERVIQNKRLSPRKTWRNYLLRGRLTCLCGRHMAGAAVGGRKNPDYRIYRCSTVGNWQNEQCTEGSINAENIEKEAWAWIAELLKEPDIRHAGLMKIQEDAEKQTIPIRQRLHIVKSLLDNSRNDAEALVEEMLSARKKGGNDRSILAQAIDAKAAELEKRTTALEAEQNRLRKTLNDLVIKDVEIERADRIMTEIGKQMLSDYDAGLEGATYEDKQAIFDLLKVKGDVIIDGNQRGVLLTCRMPGVSQIIYLNILDIYHNY